MARLKVLFLVMLFLVLISVVLLEYCQRKLSTFSSQLSLFSSSNNSLSTTTASTATTTTSTTTAITSITSASASKVKLQDDYKNSKNVESEPVTSSIHTQHDVSPAKHASARILRPIDWRPPINITTIIPDAQKTVSRKIASIFFSIKTTLRNHATRLPAMILTWMQKVPSSQVHIITDSIEQHGDEWVDIARNQGISFEKTKCPYGHHPFHLCCKSGYEFDNYFSAREAGKKYKWFCHFDDDVYVNVPMLAATLATYHPARQHVYIGRKAVRGAETTFQIPAAFYQMFPHLMHKTSYHFANGAGYCISDKMMNLLEKYLRGDLFYKNCMTLKTVDAVLLGIIIEAVIGYPLTHNPRFNSHYNLQPYSLEELKNQVTISYFLLGIQNYIVLANATFPNECDPTRFFSYHCLLFPTTGWCNK